jgi:regulator of protease activity HflC (stomatin/prohibitin superfamily)
MKKLGLVLLMAFGIFGCNNVPQGYVGVLVKTMGSNKGVENEVAGVGRYWAQPGVDLYLFPTFQQNYVWTASAHEGSPVNEEMTFQDIDGTNISADVGIAYQIDVDKVAKLFSTYRLGIEEITHAQLRNIVRNEFSNAAGKMHVSEIIGAQKEDLLKAVTKAVNAQTEPVGIHVINLYAVGAMRPPQGVTDALNAKIQATQKAMQVENEVAEAKAQAEKAIAIARGEAEANRLKTASITPQLIQYEALQKWNGTLPMVQGGNATPLINLQNLK